MLMNLLINLLLWTSYLITLYLAIFWLVVALSNINRFRAKRKKGLKHKPLVSVIIPTYNGASTIRETIESVLRLDYPKEKLEVIIVNDGSTDTTKLVVEDVIKRNPKKRIKLVNQINKGKASALNNGIKHAKGEFFACLDDDSVIKEPSLKKMLLLFQENPDLAIVTPAMKVKAPKNLLQRIQKLEYLAAIFLNRLMSYLDSVYVAPGPFSLYKKDLVIKLGGFDTKSLTEDQEIAYRMQKHNLGIQQCPDAYVYTEAPKDFTQLFSQRNRWYKGGLLNVVKYRMLFLNPSYGHFGVFQMPVNLIFLLLGGVSMLFFFNFVVMPFFNHMYDLYIIGFDLMPFIRTFEFNLDLLTLDFRNSFIFITLFLIILALTIISYFNAEESIKRQSIIGILSFLFLYYVIMGFISVVALFELMIGRYQKW